MLYEKYCEIISTIAPVYASKYFYKKASGKPINLSNPQTFNEKLMWLKLNTYYNNPLVTQCADKYRVREYVEKCGCPEILNDLIGVWDSVDEIGWDSLPDKFAIKCNHGCKYNIICDDKSKLDINDTKDKLRKWMKEDYWRKRAEVNYKFIPKKIICEKYLDTEAGFLPIDYKIYCFHGEPKLVLVCSNRTSKLKLDFYDLDWNLLDYGAEPGDTTIQKPESFPLMIEYSRKLAGDFPFVRIDFYEYQGKPIFGEMTFSPAACVAKYYNETGQVELGKMLDLSLAK
ncbi:MAG TPA: glycosyl transferase [Clostridiales bacterium]|nr:glycosyl transferase [Clostridiales bacterium]